MEKNKTNGKVPQGGGEPAVKEAVKPAASENTVNEQGQFDEKNLLTEAQPTVEDRIRKVNELSSHISDRTILRTHLEKVEALKFGEYDEKNTITISNGEDKTTYTVKSTGLCKKVTSLLKEEITAKIKEVEGKINF